MLLTKKIYEYLAILTLKEAFGSFTEWPQEEENLINQLIEKSKENLTPNEIKIVQYRLRKIKNDYWENALYNLEKMYWHELHDDDYLIPTIEYDEDTYAIWTKAVRERKSVQIQYDSTTSGLTKRIVDPYKTKSPYGEGYCHLRKSVRKFRFDRIIDIFLTDNKFTKQKKIGEIKTNAL